MSFSSHALAVLPAITSPVPAHELETAVAETLPREVKSEDYQPITDPKNVERFLKDYFADIPILAKVGACESHNRHFSKGAVLRGEKNTYDRGVMQVNILYHQETAEEMGLDLHDIDDNVAFARYLYEKYGSKPWKSSSACWSKFASSAEASGVGWASANLEIAKR